MEISHFPAFMVYPVGSFFFAKIVESLEQSARLLRKNTTQKEELAEIEKLEKFGSFLTLDTLCEGDWTKAEFYQNSEYGVIVQILYLNKEKREYQERYRKIVDTENAAKRAAK